MVRVAMVRVAMATLTMATLTMATLIQEANTYLIKVTMGSQHLTSSHQLAVHIMPVFHHNITSLVLKCKDLVAKVICHSTDSQTYLKLLLPLGEAWH